jgi:hypothetical protein
MAFGIKGADAFKDDPSLVEWLVRIAESDEQGTKNVRDVGVHLCAEQDWDRFYEPSKKAKARFESLKKGGMYCMNSVDGKGEPVDRRLFGNDDTVPYRSVEIIFKPCTP